MIGIHETLHNGGSAIFSLNRINQRSPDFIITIAVTARLLQHLGAVVNLEGVRLRRQTLMQVGVGAFPGVIAGQRIPLQK